MPNISLLQIDRDGSAFLIDAELVAKRFGLSVDRFREALRRAEIVTVCEAGEGEDAGRTRLTFRRGALLWRFVLHPNGTVTEDPIMLASASARTEGQDPR